MIRDDKFIKLWFKQDTEYKRPLANIYFNVWIPGTYSSPQSILLARLFTRMVTDSLNEYAYYASVCGLNYDIHASAEGFQVLVMGYNDKISVLIEKVFERLKTVELKKDRFETLKEQLAVGYKNFEMEQAYQLVFNKALHVLFHKRYDYTEYLQVIDGKAEFVIISLL